LKFYAIAQYLSGKKSQKKYNYGHATINAIYLRP